MQVKHLKRGTIYNILGTATVRGGIHIYDDAPIIIFKDEKGIFVTDFSCQAPSFDCEFVYFGRAQTEVTQVYGDQMVIYQDIKDSKVYARAEAEFWDGRFAETNFTQENLEFESGQLVKYNGRRIEYMGGYELIRICKEMGKLLAQDKSPVTDAEIQEALKGLLNTVRHTRHPVAHKVILKLLARNKYLSAKLAAAYLKGFQASGQGWNNEYPFMDGNEDPNKNEHWVSTRDAALKELLDEK